MGSSKLALLLVFVSCVELSLSASCIVDSFSVKQDFDPKRVSDTRRWNLHFERLKSILTVLFLFIWSFSLCSTRGSGTHCRRKTQRDCSCRTTSQLSTPLMMTAPWRPPPGDGSLCLGERIRIFSHFKHLIRFDLMLMWGKRTEALSDGTGF